MELLRREICRVGGRLSVPRSSPFHCYGLLTCLFKFDPPLSSNLLPASRPIPHTYRSRQRSSYGESMKKSEVFSAWAGILNGRAPSLSIEITKECPLRCPGCYAFDAAHLGGTTQLRDLSDFKGDELVRRVVALVDELKPLHVSLVGGDPLVRHRELDSILLRLSQRGVHTQVVTSAFRRIPTAWMKLKNLNVVISV